MRVRGSSSRVELRHDVFAQAPSAFLGRWAGRRVSVSKSGQSRRDRDGWQVCHLLSHELKETGTTAYIKDGAVKLLRVFCTQLPFVWLTSRIDLFIYWATSFLISPIQLTTKEECLNCLGSASWERFSSSSGLHSFLSLIKSSSVFEKNGWLCDHAGFFFVAVYAFYFTVFASSFKRNIFPWIFLSPSVAIVGLAKVGYQVCLFRRMQNFGVRLGCS